MKRPRPITGVLLVIAAASMAIAAHGPAMPGAEFSGRQARLVAGVVSNRLEASLAQVKSFDGHGPRQDNEGRRLPLGLTAGAAALAAAVMVTIIRCKRAQRFELAKRTDVRVRAPPGALPHLT